ncbi:hypothetical protein ACVMB3_000699 [Sinorhizobium meliloti]
MIIVVEGISAAGKTTWCKSHGQSNLIPETFPADRKALPLTGIETAQYWTDWNAKRWGDALQMERGKGLAICDTDPLKLHYSWCLCQIGALPKRQWELQLQATRTALQEKQLGFAMLISSRSSTTRQLNNNVRKTPAACGIVSNCTFAYSHSSSTGMNFWKRH